jgi:tetratricopeptide (TPR) repeat protein
MPLEVRKGTELQDRYVVVDELGVGGYATVWRATDKRLARDVAIKRLLKIKGNELESLMSEARITAGLNHTNIVQLYDTFVDGEEGFIVMEYVEGETLHALLQRHIASGGWISTADASEYFEQILEALAFAHSKGHFHRDVKPTNLLVSRLGIVKLVDFGIARPIPASSPLMVSPYGSGSALTGTPDFMSPEQARGEELDQQTDIFQAGIIGYLLFTGQHPFNHPSALHRILDLIRTDGYEPKNSKEINPSVPETLDRVLVRMLKKKKAERYATMSEALADFRPREATVSCSKCGTLNPASNKFCGACGQQVEVATTTPAAPSAASLTDEGFHLAQGDNWAGAVNKYKQALQMDPEYSKAYANLGYSLNRLGLYEEAIKILDRGIERTEENFILHGMFDSRGFSKSNITLYEQALEDFNRAVQLNPHNPRALSHRAETLALIRRYSEAYSDVLRALKIDPDYHRAQRLKERLEKQGLVSPI